MRPDPSLVLTGVVRTFARELLQELDSAYSKNSMILGNGLLNVLNVEFERLIDRLLEENQATAAILRDATAVLPDEALATRARTLGMRQKPGNYRLSTIQALNDELRAMLVEVHAAVETIPGPAAAALNDRIWAELQASTRRRQVKGGS